MRSCARRTAAVLLAWAALAAVAHAQSSAPAAAYKELLSLEASVRGALAAATPATRPRAAAGVRDLIARYEALARRYPTSGYSDNALWQGGVLAGDLYQLLGDRADAQTARRLLLAIGERFPTSSLVKKVPAQLAAIEAAGPPSPARRAASAPEPARTATRTDAVARTETAARAGTSARTDAAGREQVPSTLTAIEREVLPGAVRVILSLDRETKFTSAEIGDPARVYVDLQNTRMLYALKDTDLQFTDSVVRQIRVGRQADERTRVVVDLTRAARASVYPMYNPYRLVIDIEAPGQTAPAAAGTRTASTAATPASRPAPAPPAANGSGGYSIARQLGLHAARIVIDPGHGGHDPGARANGITEAELALDIALRLEKLLLAQDGIEVILTRRTSVYLPLAERTRIANEAGADLFLSIHANASTNVNARGIETYFLDFAPNAEAEAIAARENADSSRTMRELNEIVKAIALNNKIDESREFATIVQQQLYTRLRGTNGQARNLGVKQAPFQVLIGASMPSILAEISFITNRQESGLLKTDRYRDQIAQGLLRGIMEYQRTLKKGIVVAKAVE